MTEVGDLIDRANDQAQRITDAAVAAARIGHGLPCIERCHNRDDPVPRPQILRHPLPQRLASEKPECLNPAPHIGR